MPIKRRMFVLEPDDEMAGALGIKPNGAVVQGVSTEALLQLSHEIVDDAGLSHPLGYGAGFQLRGV